MWIFAVALFAVISGNLLLLLICRGDFFV